MDHESDSDRAILAVLQKGLPAGPDPYRQMAQQIPMAVDELLETLRRWKRQGKLRRIGAVVNHFHVGLDAGGMVVWRVAPDKTAEIGPVFADFKEVSHAYERELSPGWDYNLYTMVHGMTVEAVQETVRRMSEATGISDYRILSTRKELKKAPPTYVT